MIVIADDITGAAEIAGIALETGRPVRLLCGAESAGGDALAAEAAVTVIATDTRSMSENEAVAETRRISPPLEGLGEVFKKTDSALRGHVVVELQALMAAAGYRRAVYMPANPSKGRIIRDGIYFINGVPLHETDFRFDPEFPARSSSLAERFPDAEAAGIVMPDAESEADIRRIVAQYNDGHTLFAGGADLFRALCTTSCSSSSSLSTPLSPWRGAGGEALEALILCGSTQSSELDLGIPVAPMPKEVYDGSADLSLWHTDAYREGRGLILSIPHRHRTGKAVAVHLRSVMARMACSLISQHRPAQLVIEGGATAWTTLQQLGWTRFDIERQVAPGVVQMRATSGTLVTLKPGSYPWGGLFSVEQQ